MMNATTTTPVNFNESFDICVDSLILLDHFYDIFLASFNELYQRNLKT